MAISRDLIKTLRQEVDEALQIVAKKHGVKITAGNATFNADNAVIKLDIASLSADGAAITKEATWFQRNAQFLGLKAEDLGKTFNYGGKNYTITGGKAGRGTSYVLASGNDKSYKFPTDIVKLLVKS